MIVWNKYTWYSKLAALIFFVLILPMWAFYVGVKYEETAEVARMAKEISLQATQPADTAASNIAGTYNSDGTVLTIIKGVGGTYEIQGNAQWEGENAGQENVGTIDGTLHVAGNKGTYSDGYCKIDFTFSKNALSAQDNLQCGGFNVSFTGEYAKQ